MRAITELLIHFLCTLFILLKPGGVKAVIAENLALKQQLIVLNREKVGLQNLMQLIGFSLASSTFLLI